MTDQPGAAFEQKNAKKFAAFFSEKRENIEVSDLPPSYTRVKKPSSRSYRGKAGSTLGSSTRETLAISVEQCKMILSGVQHADRIGLPLNRMITIDWTLGGVDDAQRGRQRLFNLIYDWVRTKGHDTAHVWVMENGEKFGVHSHILIHVPPVLRKEFNRRFRGWRKCVGLRWLKGVVNTQTIGRSLKAAFAKDAGRKSYLLNAQRVTQYILKAATPTARQRCGLTTRTPKFSAIRGKRCGTSRNIGEAAIRKFEVEQKQSKVS